MNNTVNRLIELASKRFGVAAESLAIDDDFFAKLGINSVQSLELLSDVEMTFDVEIPDYELHGVATFAQLASKIDERRV